MRTTDKYIATIARGNRVVEDAQGTLAEVLHQVALASASKPEIYEVRINRVIAETTEADMPAAFHNRVTR
jgi:hypothetical protein